MAKTDFTIPSLGNKFIDLRDVIPGDSYNWNWTRPLSGVNYLAIHHSGGPSDQTPNEIADFHIKNNGWGGIGYHFLISKEGLVYYVGDISTARANVANLNEQVIGICLIGNFINGDKPSDEQLDCLQKLCDFLINDFPNLSGIQSWDQVAAHKELPGQLTQCPGDSWNQWKTRIGPADGMQYDKSYWQSQVDSLQTSLAAVNQQVISLQENLAERDREIAGLKQSIVAKPADGLLPAEDHTLTITHALVKLYQYIFPPGKEAPI